MKGKLEELHGEDRGLMGSTIKEEQKLTAELAHPSLEKLLALKKKKKKHNLRNFIVYYDTQLSKFSAISLGNDPRFDTTKALKPEVLIQSKQKKRS